MTAFSDNTISLLVKLCIKLYKQNYQTKEPDFSKQIRNINDLILLTPHWAHTHLRTPQNVAGLFGLRPLSLCRLQRPPSTASSVNSAHQVKPNDTCVPNHSRKLYNLKPIKTKKSTSNDLKATKRFCIMPLFSLFV